MKDRLAFIKKLRAKRMTYRAIGNLLGISKQRVRQIETGYRSKPLIPPEKHKKWTPAKRATLGLSTINVSALGINGGRDSLRELVRIRDNRTCQMCFKKWKPGTRRFDVHHQDERQEGTSADPKSVRRDKKSLDKMITLCHRCHINLDSVRGKIRRGHKKARTLTAYEKRKINQMLITGRYLLKDIAKKFGVTTMCISRYNKRIDKALKNTLFTA